MKAEDNGEKDQNDQSQQITKSESKWATFAFEDQIQITTEKRSVYTI